MSEKIISVIGSVFIFIILSIFSGLAQAQVVLGTTRVIVDGVKKEVDFFVRNENNNNEALIQTWIEGNGKNKTDVPFALTPPVSRIAPKSVQLVRILYAGVNSNLPLDKESVFWINVHSIPQKTDKENVLQISMNQKIKLFYRPKDIKGDPLDAPLQLQWSVTESDDGEVLKVFNPSAYHVSVPSINVEGLADDHDLMQDLMIAPGQELGIPFQKKQLGNTISFTSINDYGAVDFYRLTLRDNLVAHPVRVGRNNE